MQAITDKRWEIKPAATPEQVNSLSGYSKVLRQLLVNRGILSALEAEVYLAMEGPLYDPFLMLGMEKTVERILSAIDLDQKVIVYGDYDVDGVTATTLMVQAIRALGGDAEGYIPNRFDEGYGLNLEALDNLSEQGVRLVVTVDCGIRSPREADRAHDLGIDLIITDHHEPRNELPEAYSVLCPKQAGDAYPEKNLAGVGLAFKVAEGLFKRRYPDSNRYLSWLDLVAIGTVADIVPLTGENRSLVRAGLKLLRQGSRQGVRSLAGAASIEMLQNLSARDIGFVIGPRLNAAGRLESAMDALALLMADSPETAGPLAQKLDNQNRDRQEITRQMQADAEQIAQSQDSPYLLFAARGDFNPGVVGLAAARLTETYYRPSIVGSFLEDGCMRASCRSIPEFHITHALDECADLLVRHGGHSMAAGFTVKQENLEVLIRQMMEIAERELKEKDLRPILKADLEIPFSDLRPEILKDLEMLEPTGLANSDATFVSRNLKVERFRRIGNEGNHLKLTVSDGRIFYDAVAFRQGYWADQMPERVDLLYAYEKNVYNGRENLQLNVKDIKPSQG